MVASRLKGVDISGIRKMFDAAAPDAINLGLGEPDFQPPAHVIDAYKAALSEGKNKYGPTFGLPALRSAIADSVACYRKGASAQDAIVTSGATQALMATMLAIIDHGDDVLIPDPGFVIYEPHVKLCGGTPVHYALDGDIVENVAAALTAKTKAIVVNSPSNPTGAVLGINDVRGIVDLAEEKKLTLISDEVYDKFVYDGSHVSFLGDGENVVFINSFSKTYAMTGWRLGYLVTTNRELMNAIMKASYHMIACAPTPTQYAALAALVGPQKSVEMMIAEFRKRRDFVVTALNAIEGVSCETPKGAFYAFPSFSGAMTSAEFSQTLLKNGVVVTPGSAFGPRGEGHFRISYATSLAHLEKGLARIKKIAEAPS